jgi:carbon-monoxide dehydrogenase medium subunit
MTDYISPASIEEAIGYLATYDGEARIVAGGTDVMPDIRRGKIVPRCLVDITRTPGLDRIEVAEAGTLREQPQDFVQVGAAVTFAQLKNNPFVNQHVHALAEAARSVGVAAIQNAATWVGNLVQSMPAADGVIVALALEAQVRIVDRTGTRWTPVESLFAGPGVCTVDPTRQLVTHIRFPCPRFPWGTGWARIGRRSALVLPILNCAAKLCLAPDGSRIARACIALGPVAPRPLRAREAEAFLQSQPPTAKMFAQAACIAREESNPRSSHMRASREYRLAVIPSMVSDALEAASRRARDKGDK